MEYNLLEEIDKKGKDRVIEGMNRAVDYDEHCNSQQDFEVELSEDGF